MNYKHVTLFICAILLYEHSFAQPRIKAQGVIGANNNEGFSSMYLTSDGGLIVGGISNSNISDQKTENSRGFDDYWIVKLDNAGNIQWDKTIGGSKYEYLDDMQQTADGGYILGGWSSSDSSGEKTQNSKGKADYWVVKLDGAGNIQWDRTIGGSDAEYLSTIQQTDDGGYILGGESESNMSGDKTENSKGFTDYWIVKLDGAGNIQWDKTIGGSSSDIFNSLQKTTDGGYVLSGHSFSNFSGDKTENSKGGADYWIVKLDASGNIEWDKTIGGGNSDFSPYIQQAADGGYIVGGKSLSNMSGDKTENSKGESDYWIVKLNSRGNIQWDKTIGGSTDDDLLSVRQTVDNGYILGGSSESNISGDKTENSRGGYDYWIVKTDSHGKVQWDKTIGGNSNDGLSVIREIKKNDYAVGGSSTSGISSDKTGGNRGKSNTGDYWIVKLKYIKPDSTASTQILNTGKLQTTPENSNSAISVYPNPVRDKLNIQTKGKATFMLTNQSGKTIITKTINNSGTIDVSHVPAGIYFLTNTTTGATQRIVVSR